MGCYTSMVVLRATKASTLSFSTIHVVSINDDKGIENGTDLVGLVRLVRRISGCRRRTVCREVRLRLRERKDLRSFWLTEPLQCNVSKGFDNYALSIGM